MSDHVEPETRSRIMRAVGSAGTRPELAVRRSLHSLGFRYRINDKRYPGSPDIVLPRFATVIFVHGCFWHKHEGCTKARLPKTNTGFWQAKQDKNAERDRKNIAELESKGWQVIVVWQCEISNRAKREGRLNKLVKEIRSADGSAHARDGEITDG